MQQSRSVPTFTLFFGKKVFQFLIATAASDVSADKRRILYLVVGPSFMLASLKRSAESRR